MNKIYPTVISEQSVMVAKGSNRLLAQRDHINYHKIIERIKEGNFNNIEQLFEIKNTLEKYFNVTIKNGREVFYKGRRIENALTRKILSFYKSNLPYTAWAKFLDKLMQNPSQICRDQLFNYVENWGLPVDSEGFVYAWKAIQKDYFDKYTGKTHKYKVGSIIKMDRDKCEGSELMACGPGLHAGETSYVTQYGSGDDRYVLVRFSPKDAVSCPKDCDWKKLRTCKLKVVREVSQDDVLPLEDRYMGKNGKNRPKRDKSGRFTKK
jgi:hypothetical protein